MDEGCREEAVRCAGRRVEAVQQRFGAFVCREEGARWEGLDWLHHGGGRGGGGVVVGVVGGVCGLALGDSHDGSVAIITLPTPWYRPRNSAGFGFPVAACV